MPTIAETAITQSPIVGNLPQVWRYAVSETATPFDEATVVPGWMPSGPSWEDVSDRIGGAIEFNHDGTGYTFKFTALLEDRSVWYDGRLMMLTAQHYTGTSWDDPYVVCWGRIVGDGDSHADPGRKAKGTYTVSYTKDWERATIDGKRFGKPNLALGATITYSSPVLASPMSEFPLEFESQADVAANRIVDGNSDTVSVLDVIAYPAAPAVGDTEIPRILRLYNGRFPSRSVGAGGECVWLELWAGHNHTPWGDFEGDPASLPGLNDPNDYDDQPPTIGDDADHTFSISPTGGRNGTKGLLMRFKQRNYANGQPAEPYLQWNLGATPGYPMKMTLWLKAASPGSIGKVMTLACGLRFGETRTLRIALPSAYTKYEFVWDSVGPGGILFRLRCAPGEMTSDIYAIMDDFRISTGYSDQGHSDNYQQRFHMTFDDGNGHIRWIRPSWELGGGGEFRIPADDSVIICDDAALFKARFDPGNRTVLQMRNIWEYMYFAPGVGRIRTGWNGLINFFAWETNPSFELIELIDFSPGGNANDRVWTAQQALSRQSPIGTGALTVESFPHVGLLPGEFGVGYWVVDLGAYRPAMLTRDITTLSTSLPVDNLDEFPPSGRVKVEAEYMAYSGKTDNALILTARGLSSAGVAAGSTIVDHDTGAYVTPMLTDGLGTDSGTALGTFPQSGWLIDTIELRRKAQTPRILSGVVLTSNLTAPRDPSDPGNAVGAKWERHPDWRLVTRWADRTSGSGEVIGFRMTDTIRQARHVAVVIDRMDTVAGQPQRAKLNELVVRKASPVGTLAGGWGANSVNTLGALVLNLLLKHTKLPESKVLPRWLGPTIDTISVAPGTVAQAISSATGQGLMQVWCDPWNRVVIDASPSHTVFDARAPEWTWNESDVQGDLGVTWAEAARIAQVRVVATEPETLRVFTASYPDTRLNQGEVKEFNNIIAHSAEEAAELAHTLFRDLRTRKSCTIKARACPWLRPWQRHTVNWPSLDASGEQVGVNMVVTGFQGQITLGRGGWLWRTTITLREMAI